ncbi:MAG TPA: hypothetical protein VKT77_07640 [Chthonomonadaceae bacterium]|nr:hypothetical protein [Chthonomonadaceae bacterium]
MKTITRFASGIALTAGLAAVLLGGIGASAARADDWESYGRNHIYRDIADIRRDQRILRDLQARHDEARRNHDWPRMHELDRKIAALRRHIESDRRDLHADVRRGRDERYRR